MKLRTKLIIGFASVAVITLGISVQAYWQVDRLSAALYEVGVVRLPSIRGLNQMNEAMLALHASENAALVSRGNAAILKAEQERQGKLWHAFEEGWSLYEPLPQSDREAVLWKQFIRTSASWRSHFQAVIDQIAGLAFEAGPTSSGSGKLETESAAAEASFLETAQLLHDLTAVNYAIADQTKLQSITSRQDVLRLQATMLWAGIAGVFCAALVGLLFGHFLSKPLVRIAGTLEKFSKGDLSPRIKIGSDDDEVGAIAVALNGMVEGLRTGEARLQALSDNLPLSAVYQVVRETNGAMRFLYVSARVEALHGFTAAALLENPTLFYHQILEEDRGALLAARERSLTDLTPVTLTVRIRHADGDIRWMHLSSAPRRLSDGRTVWDGIETDVTERHNARARLQESEVRFQVVFDHSIDAIGVSKDLQVIMVNPAFFPFFGYDRTEDMTRYSVFDFVAPESHPIIHERISRRARGEELPATLELRGLRKDGSEFDMEVHSSLFVMNGERYSIALHRDITERKRTEAEIRRANRALKTIRECHELLMHATAEPALLKRICEVIASSGGYRAAWVGFVEPHTGATIHPFTQAGASDEDFRVLSDAWLQADHQAGPTARALRTGQPAVCRNFQTDPEMVAWREDAKHYGFNSALVLPLRTEGVTLGTLSIYSAETDGFDASEISLLWGLADNLAFGVQGLRARQLHERAESEVRRLLNEAETGRSALLSILEDQKLAEDALQRSEERFRSAMLNSAIGMALAHPNGRCIEVNPALCRIVGYTRDELIVRDFPAITHPDDRAADSLHFHRLLDGKCDTYEIEKRYVRKDGQFVWVQLNVSLVRDASGQPLHSIAQIQDITERRTIATAREEILERLRLALKTGHLGTFRRNLATGEGQWDDQSFELMGRPVSAGTPNIEEFFSMVHPEDRVKLMNTMNSAVALRREVFCSFRFFRPDGSLRHFDAHAMVEPEAHGRRDWITGVFSDVSEIVEAQQNLKHAAQRLQLALSTSKLGVWEFNLETGETRWDERMHEIYRLEQPASIPTTAEFRSLIVPEDRDAVTQAWQRMLKGGPNYRIHFRITFPNGETRHIDAHAVAQCDQHNRPISVIGVDSDVTDLVAATAESERLREQLQQAQKMEALGTLAAGVAHDFNNLLTGINGFVDLAASSLPPGHEAADLLKQALRGAMNARDLVRRILDFSRGRGDQARTRVDLSELVRDTAPLISAALPSNVSLSTAVANEVSPVLADPGQLQQILMNLCVNGSHAIGSQPGTLRVAVSRQVFDLSTAALPPNCEPGEYTCLAVTDTGCGMDEAVRKRIFEPFFTTKKAGVGTGLGLSIVRDIVTAHRGGIAVESSVGAGTTFSIYFPAMSAADLPVSKPSVNPENRGAGQRIMVVDDEPAVAMVLRLSLQKCGFKPEVYTSPIDAWKRFTHAPDDFDLLMVDQFMPELGGHEFIEQARRISANIPVIVMSGRFERSELSSSHETPDVFELKKPFEISDLISAVNHSLHRTHGAPTGEPSPL